MSERSEQHEIWNPLDWDSDFFGFGIGRIELEGASVEAILEAEREARAAGIVCLYASMDPSPHEQTYVVQTLGYRFTEASVRYDLSPRADVPLAAEHAIRPGTPDDLPSIDDALVKMAPWSRYAVDPHFGVEAAVRIHRAWVERAARCDTGERDLRIAVDDSGVVAFATRNNDPHPMIDTMASTVPGGGAASSLVADAQAWADPEVLWGGWIASRNVASTRFVEQCGFRISEVRYSYHRWLDDT